MYLLHTRTYCIVYSMVCYSVYEMVYIYLGSGGSDVPTTHTYVLYCLQYGVL
jgi:hypothetical protein